MPATAIMGGISAYSAYNANKRAGQAQDQNSQALALQRDQMDKQGKLSNTLMGYADKTYNLAQPALNTAMKYYGTLANGSRAGINQTLAPQLAQLSDTYKGSTNAVNTQLRGGARDYALAELNRGAAGQAGMMPMAARTGAMASLAGLGTTTMGQAGGWAGNATSALNGSAATANSMARNSYDAYKDARDQAQQAGGNFYSQIKPALNLLPKWNPLGKSGGGMYGASGGSSSMPNDTDGWG